MKESSDELKKLEFEKCLEQRNFEIGNFWSRGWFFGALLVLIATGYFQLMKKNPEYCIYLAFLGFWVSLFQTLMNRGSKYWQERWENKTKNAESALGVDITLTKKYDGTERYYLDAGILAKNENCLVKARRFSVSKLTILTWDIVTISWAFTWFKACNFNTGGSIRVDALLHHIIIIAYILLFFFLKSRKHTPKETIINGGNLLGYSGGKVYERFMKDKGLVKNGPNNIRDPYYKDSEDYYKNKNINNGDQAN